MSCTCEPVSVQGYHFNSWIGEYLRDCIYTPQDYFSVTFAYIGLCASVMSLFPQFLVNYKRKSADGLSFYLLLFWTLGDFGSLTGSLLTGQQQPQIVTAFVFFVLDFSMMLQYFWYEYVRPRLFGYTRIPADEVVVPDSSSILSPSPAAPSPLLSPALSPVLSPSLSHSNPTGLMGLAASLLPPGAAGAAVFFKWQNVASLAILPLCDGKPVIEESVMIIGYFLAWSSGTFYFTSRIPQVYKNYKEKNVEGLSLYLFCLTIIGNLGYGISVVLRLPQIDRHFFLATLPYLIGSLGVLLFDLFTLVQFAWYSKQQIVITSPQE